MAIVNKATLKGFFEQGDIPTQGQYFNLIDSTFNLADTDAQVLQGTISASVGDFEHLKLKKAFIPGIGVGTAKVGTSFVIGNTLEIVGDLNLTNGNVSASGTGVNGSGSFTSLHVQDYGNITSSGTIKANQFFFSDSLNNLIQDGQLSLADADADDISLFAGLNGVDQGQGFIRTDGKGFTLLLDKDNGVTGEFFNIKKNGVLPNLGTELLRLDEDGSITLTANVTASAIQASGNITSSGNIKANGNIVGDDSTTISGIASIFSTDIKIGEDDETKIDFETANEIHFYANNVEQVYLGDNIFGPQSDSDVDLGTTGVRWKDAYIDSVTVTGTVQAEQLTSTDDINATDDITAGGDIKATTGNFIGNNMGAIPFTHIPMVPSDFGAGDSIGKDGVIVGTSIRTSDSSINLYASYVIPQGIQIRTMQIYGDPGVTAAVIESSIENDTESTLASGIAPGSGAACLSSAGDGLKYVTVKLSFTNTTVEFHGGKLNIAQA